MTNDEFAVIVNKFASDYMQSVGGDIQRADRPLMRFASYFTMRVQQMFGNTVQQTMPPQPDPEAELHRMQQENQIREQQEQLAREQMHLDAERDHLPEEHPFEHRHDPLGKRDFQL